MKLFKNLIQHIKRLRINQQIFLLVIIMITVPLLISSTIIYFYSLQSIKKEHEVSSDLILNNLSFNIDQYLNNIESGVLGIYMKSDFQKILEQWGETKPEVDPYLNLQTESELGRFIGSIHSSVSDIESVQIYTDKQIFHSSFLKYNVIDVIDMKDSLKYQRVIEAKGGLIFFGTHTSEHGSNNQEIISIGRAINKKGSKQALGAIFINIKLDAIRDILSLSETSNRRFVIFDDQGSVIFASDDSIVGSNMQLTPDNQALKQVLLKDKSSFYTEVNHVNSFINYVSSPYSGWTVAQYIDQSEMTKQSDKLRGIVFLLGIISFFVAISFMYILRKRVTKPIIQLSNQVVSFGKGNLDTRLENERQDEFGVLYQEINQMADDLCEYIERTSVLKAKQKIAQYSALKSQIHPHFLANALESIQMQAVINDQREISEMIGLLGELFRKVTQSGKDLVPLEDELSHIRLYIQVQQIRFGDRVQYVEKVAPETLTKDVLHFLLQPFVENAIIHGLEPKYENGYIQIESQIVEQNMQINIHDNGVGMSKDRLEDIRKNLAQQSERLENKRIGIKNVHDQIRYYFGKEYGVEIESQLGVGTTVTITLPIA